MTFENKMISVIVPVYNAEPYLERCINSIVNQTYQNLEILLIDDGSTDKSGIICDLYHKKDTRVKVIHKKNGGAATARNLGVHLAKGQFLAFVDSDDAILTDMYASLMIQMKEDIDIVTCGRYIYKQGSKQLKQKAYCTNKITKYGNVQAIGELLKKEIFSYGVNEKIYRKELFENIKFPYSRMSEDIPVTYALFKKCRYIVNIGQAKYCNYLRRDSSSNSDNFFLRMKYVYFMRDIYIDIQKEMPQYSWLAEAEYLRGVLYILREIKQCKQRQKYRRLEKRLRHFLRRMVFRVMLNCVLSYNEKKELIKNAI